MFLSDTTMFSGESCSTFSILEPIGLSMRLPVDTVTGSTFLLDLFHLCRPDTGIRTLEVHDLTFDLRKSLRIPTNHPSPLQNYYRISWSNHQIPSLILAPIDQVRHLRICTSISLSGYSNSQASTALKFTEDIHVSSNIQKSLTSCAQKQKSPPSRIHYMKICDSKWSNNEMAIRVEII